MIAVVEYFIPLIGVTILYTAIGISLYRQKDTFDKVCTCDST